MDHKPVKPNQERGLEWLTLLAIVILIGLTVATLSIIRDRESRFDQMQSALQRIENAVTKTAGEPTE